MRTKKKGVCLSLFALKLEAPISAPVPKVAQKIDESEAMEYQYSANIKIIAEISFFHMSIALNNCKFYKLRKLNQNAGTSKFFYSMLQASKISLFVRLLQKT